MRISRDSCLRLIEDSKTVKGSISNLVLLVFGTFSMILTASVLVGTKAGFIFLALGLYTVFFFLFLIFRAIYISCVSTINLIIIMRQESLETRKKLLPSKLSLFFAGALQKPENREFILDNIEERFKKDAKKRGYRWAKWMLWRDNLETLWIAIGAKVIKGLKWLGFGYLIERFLLK